MLREPAAAQDLGDDPRVIGVRRAGPALLGRRRGPEVSSDAVQLLAIDDRPARAVGQREVGRQTRAGQHDRVGPPDPASAPPPRSALDVFAERVLALTRLPYGVDDLVAAVELLAPVLAVVPDRAALDLDRDDRRTGQHHRDVDLVVLPAVRDPHVRQQQVLVAELVAQQRPHLALTGRGERRRLRSQHRHSRQHGRARSSRRARDASHSTSREPAAGATPTNLWKLSYPPTTLLAGSGNRGDRDVRAQGSDDRECERCHAAPGVPAPVVAGPDGRATPGGQAEGRGHRHHRRGPARTTGSTQPGRTGRRGTCCCGTPRGWVALRAG